MYDSQWAVEVTDEFVEWWVALSVDQQESVTDVSTCSPDRGPIWAGRWWTASAHRGTTT